MCDMQVVSVQNLPQLRSNFKNSPSRSTSFSYYWLRFAWRCSQIPQGKYLGHKKHFCANKTFQSCCFTFIHLIILHFRAKAIIIFTLTPAASPVCFCVYVCSVCLIFIISRVIAWATHCSLLHQKVSFIYYVLQTVQQHKDKPAVMLWKRCRFSFSPFLLSGKDHTGSAHVIHGQTHFLQQQQHGSIVKL